MILGHPRHAHARGCVFLVFVLSDGSPDDGVHVFHVIRINFLNCPHRRRVLPCLFCVGALDVGSDCSVPLHPVSGFAVI